MSPTIEDQPPPIPNKRRPIWDLVIDDMLHRDHLGRQRYGTPLQAQNGRDPLVDAYQESLDQTVYLRQALEERTLGDQRYIDRIAELEGELERLDRAGGLGLERHNRIREVLSRRLA